MENSLQAGAPLSRGCILLPGVWALSPTTPELVTGGPTVGGPELADSSREDRRLEQGRDAGVEGLRVEESACG